MNTSYRSLAALLCAAVLTSCDKTAVQDITGPVPGSAVKFFNFGVNAPGLNFYANTTKMTAISSATGAEAITGVAYGLAGSSGFYSAIAPGSYTLTGKIAAVTDKDLAVSTVAATFADGKRYSFYASGFYDAVAKNVESFYVEDPIPAAIDYSNAVVRFVNAISNAAPMGLYAKNTTTLAEVAVGTEVAYKAAGVFATLPAGVYDLNTRYAGSATNVITRAAVSLVAGKVYTIGARGDITIVSTTLTNRPILDNTANR